MFVSCHKGSDDQGDWSSICANIGMSAAYDVAHQLHDLVADLFGGQAKPQCCYQTNCNSIHAAACDACDFDLPNSEAAHSSVTPS